MRKKHKILDHSILAYFLLMIFVSIVISLGSLLDTALCPFIPGYASNVTVVAGREIQSASGVGVAIASLAALGIFKLWFRPEFKGCLAAKGLKAGILMLLPFLILHYAGSIVSWLTVGTSSVLIAFLRSFAPGFGEEVMFRGLGIANFMRTIRSEKQISVIFWLSSVIFGLSHIMNILGGGDPFSVLIQSIYAIGVGMLFGAVYLRTGNLWPTILGHMSVDFMEFIRADLGASGGLMMGMGIGDWITIAAAVFAAVWGLLLMKRKFYPDIMQIWKEKWNGATE